MLDRAERLARSLDLPDVLSDALNTRACVLGMMEDPAWFEVMRTSIEIAREHALHPQSGRGYANMHDLLARAHRFPEAVSWYREGMAYCNDHDIATYGSCLLAGAGRGRARPGPLGRGRVDEPAGPRQALPLARQRDPAPQDPRPACSDGGATRRPCSTST